MTKYIIMIKSEGKENDYKEEYSDLIDFQMALHDALKARTTSQVTFSQIASDRILVYIGKVL